MVALANGGSGRGPRLASRTLLDKTRMPLKIWFRAIFEISARRTGISGKDLQHIMGFICYKTARSCLQKLRVAMVHPDRQPLGRLVQVDEALVPRGGERTGARCPRGDQR